MGYSCINRSLSLSEKNGLHRAFTSRAALALLLTMLWCSFAHDSPAQEIIQGSGSKQPWEPSSQIPKHADFVEKDLDCDWLEEKSILSGGYDSQREARYRTQIEKLVQNSSATTAANSLKLRMLRVKLGMQLAAKGDAKGARECAYQVEMQVPAAIDSKTELQRLTLYLGFLTNMIMNMDAGRTWDGKQPPNER
jgi:hypothetical protein